MITVLHKILTILFYFVMYKIMLLNMEQIKLPFILNIMSILEDVRANRNILCHILYHR
jgi:hypothetical protein